MRPPLCCSSARAAATRDSAAGPSLYSRLVLWNNAAVGTIYVDDAKVAGTYNGPTGAGATPLPQPTTAPTSTPTPTSVPPTVTPTPLPAGQYLVGDFEGGLGGWAKQGPGSATAQGGTVNSGTGAVALATEEVALRQALGDGFAAREPAPGTVRVWTVKEVQHAGVGSQG